VKLRRGRRVALEDRLAALEEAVELGTERVPDDLLAPARDVLRRTDERRARGDRAVVVALVGGTGTGKSSLFNALAGGALADVDVRRPTTDAATSWTVGDAAEAVALLDWLEVAPDRRHHASDGAAPRDRRELDGLEGLVLVDLPDVDSVVTANRTTADRLIERVDVLVWVVDPHKYAQRSLHEGYLARLREHAEVMLVALNHADRLDADERRTCRSDLERLVTVDGAGPEVLLTSATTGEGVDALRRSLQRTVRSQRAVAERIAADVRAAASGLLGELAAPATGLGGARSGAGEQPDAGTVAGGAPDAGALSAGQVDAGALNGGQLIADLAGLADLDGFAEQAHAAYVHAARRRLRTPLLGLLQTLLAAVRAVVSGVARIGGAVTHPRRGVPARGPAAGTTGTGGGPAGWLDARHALLAVVERARRGLPWFWAEAVDAAAERAGERLPTSVKAALAEVALEPARRRWWGAAAAVWLVAELTVAVGIGWLLLDRAARWLGLPGPPIPQVTDRVSWPSLLVALGLAVWLVVAAIRRIGVRAGARRHRDRTRRAAEDAVRAAVRITALAPLEQELAAFDRIRDQLRLAAT
jgi:GTP-binding protein EngB required for normal cell division